METETVIPTFVQLPCAECGELFNPSQTKTKICLTCVSKDNDITEGIPKEVMLPWCRYCHKFFGTSWVQCQRESKELLGICLKKISGLKKLKLLDANFIWTEEHSKRIKLKITAQKDITQDVTIQQTFKVSFHEVYTQCDECRKQFTPHTWRACVQVRQKVKNKKTFLYLEQVMLKNQVHKKAIKIEKEENGMDFFFKNKSHAQKLIDFLNGQVPHSNKESKQLISQDTRNNSYNYKYTFYIEIPKICRNDIVILPMKLCTEFGGVNNLGICYKVTSKIHLFDPITMRKYAMNSHQYFNFENEITIIPFSGNETMFSVVSIYKEEQSFNQNTSLADIDVKFARVEVERDSDKKQFCGSTHLGHILKHGDQVLGFDLEALNSNIELGTLGNQRYLPDFILMRKVYHKKRIWDLQRMKVDVREEGKKKRKREVDDEMRREQEELEDFKDEIEQDKNLRMNMNLVKIEEAN